MGAWGRGVEVRARCGVWIMTGALAFSPRKPTKEISSQYAIEGSRPRKNKRRKRHVEKQKREELSLFPWHQ
jgi:hypothetical protein